MRRSPSTAIEVVAGRHCFCRRLAAPAPSAAMHRRSGDRAPTCPAPSTVGCAAWHSPTSTPRSTSRGACSTCREPPSSSSGATTARKRRADSAHAAASEVRRDRQERRRFPGLRPLADGAVRRPRSKKLIARLREKASGLRLHVAHARRAPSSRPRAGAVGRARALRLAVSGERAAGSPLRVERTASGGDRKSTAGLLDAARQPVWTRHPDGG